MKLVVHLKGGLGNQLFQYATGRAISARSGAELVLDDVSGFARDRRFRRTFELGRFPIAARTATRAERLVAAIDKLTRPIQGRRRLLRRMPWGDFLRETAHRCLPEVEQFRMTRSTWMNGYWQAPCYFEPIAAELRRELDPPVPEDPRILALGREMESCESLAVGVRLYEEDRNPAANARDGRLKQIPEQADAVHALLRANPGATPFVFCTHRAPALDGLRMPRGTVFVTETDGFRGAVPNLWLLARCRHHVFNNSSFYWWGAWLSETRHAGHKGTIVASDNFINADGLPQGWSMF